MTKSREKLSGCAERILATATNLFVKEVLDTAYRKLEYYRAGLIDVPGSEWSIEVVTVAQGHLYHSLRELEVSEQAFMSELEERETGKEEV